MCSNSPLPSQKTPFPSSPLPPQNSPMKNFSPPPLCTNVFSGRFFQVCPPFFFPWSNYQVSTCPLRFGFFFFSVLYLAKLCEFVSGEVFFRIFAFNFFPCSLFRTSLPQLLGRGNLSPLNTLSPNFFPPP